MSFSVFFCLILFKRLTWTWRRRRMVWRLSCSHLAQAAQVAQREILWLRLWESRKELEKEKPETDHARGRGRGPRTRIEVGAEDHARGLRTKRNYARGSRNQRGGTINEERKSAKWKNKKNTFVWKYKHKFFFYTDMAWVACCKYIHIHTQLLNHTCAHRYNVAEKGQ